MSMFFDEDSRPLAVDETHPVDILEPEVLERTRNTPDALTLVERIGSTFTRGNPFIIQVAWSFLLNQQSRSIRTCAARVGCTPQAISRQITQLSNEFDYPLRNQLRRQIQRTVANRSWERKRREEQSPPAVARDQSKTDAPPQAKGGHP